MGEEKLNQLTDEEHEYNLIARHPKSWQRQKFFFIFLGITYLLNGYLYYLDEKIEFGITYSLLGTLLIIFYIFDMKIVKYSGIKISREMISFPKSFTYPTRKRIQIKWNEVKEIEYKPLKVIFTHGDNERKTLRLDNFGYKDIKDIKSKIDLYFNSSKNSK